MKAKHNQATSLVKQMTLEEKTAYASGKNFWHLEGCARLELEPVMITDGPHGLRKQVSQGDHVGIEHSVPSTCFPTASGLAASWNLELLEEIGVALGEQCVAERVAVLLGPGMNIKRHPQCGRNFEYFSEDPLLSGKLAAAMIHGVQSQGVGTSVKHYAVNNQEQGRMYVDAIVDERALREIYLRGFEIAVREAKPWTVMCAYNRVNGTYCSDHNWLLNQVLRDEWGFEGLVMTDWGAMNDRIEGVKSGLDLEMPSSGGENDRLIAKAVQCGKLDEDRLDTIIIRNVSLTLCGQEAFERTADIDLKAHHKLARQTAQQSAVLLKNNGILPITNTPHIAVIGAFAKCPRYQGAGSSRVNATRIDNAFDAIHHHVGQSVQLSYAEGYEPIFSKVDEDLINEAVETARAADVAIVFAGLPESYESEGFDRTHISLPEQHDQLIESVCRVNKNTIVVLCNGAPVSMPWVDLPSAILECYLGGQAGGTAVKDLLFGLVNPSGKLAETFPLSVEDIPSDRWFPGENRQVQYREGIYIGYRYFDSAMKQVLFPFGHGLSYTEFEYSNFRVNQQNSNVTIEVDITNKGPMAGAEIVQLYVSPHNSQSYRPEQELKAFVRVVIDPKKTETVTLSLNEHSFEIYDPQVGGWIIEPGSYELRVGASSRDIRLSETITISSADIPSEVLTMEGPSIADSDIDVSDEVFEAMLGHAIPPREPTRPFHINSSMKELANESWLGKKIRAKAISSFMSSLNLDRQTVEPTTFRMFEAMVDDMPLRGLALLSNGKIKFKQVDALIAILNRQYIKALHILMSSAKKSP
jgi:beta-glucosidase